jgi:hypothetical protein
MSLPMASDSSSRIAIGLLPIVSLRCKPPARIQRRLTLTVSKAARAARALGVRHFDFHISFCTARFLYNLPDIFGHLIDEFPQQSAITSVATALEVALDSNSELLRRMPSASVHASILVVIQKILALDFQELARVRILQIFLSLHSTFSLAIHNSSILLMIILEMAKFIGSDCTTGALEWQFRRYKAGAKLQIAAVKAGQDPKNINVDVNPQGKPDGKRSGGTNSTSFLSFSLQHSTSSLRVNSY